MISMIGISDMPGYYGNLVDDATKRRLNNEAVNHSTRDSRASPPTRALSRVTPMELDRLPTPAGRNSKQLHAAIIPGAESTVNPLGFLNDAANRPSVSDARCLFANAGFHRR